VSWKLLLDENLSPQHASELRSAGYDACGVLDVGLPELVTNVSDASPLRTGEYS
jgi:predicted nuclease of predicted toxin-antitoxin system